MTALEEFTQEELLQCLNQVEELKKIKDINLMGKKLGLRRFKKAEKVLAREMIVNKLQEFRDKNNSDLDSLSDVPSPPSIYEDEDDEIEQDEKEIVVSVQEPREEMTVPEVEDKPELVDIEKQEVQNTYEMYQTINKMVENLRNNEEQINQKVQSLEEKTKKQEETISQLNNEIDNLFKKYELTCSENEKLNISNLKLKEAVRNLMGDL